jgi:GH15 family glucan-1,4-alpha-glucosidase
MDRMIENYALIGDLHTAALVGIDGSMDWLCLPHFDSPACFAALVGDEDNGHWRLAPVSGGHATSRQYRDTTMILETLWTTSTGTVRVIDCMPPRDDVPDVIRIVEGVDGVVEMHSEIRFRFDYGRVVPWVRHDSNQVSAIAGPDAVWLRTPVPQEGRDFATHSTFTVKAGDRVPFVMAWTESHLPEPPLIDAFSAVADTETFWQDWLADCTYGGRWKSVVQRSLVVLKTLTYRPTGGIVAAPTTSLPEEIGGQRNWDYRYCWLRDASLTLRALINSGHEHEAMAWSDWLVRAVAGDPADLQTVYSISGSRRLPEWEVPWLAGFQGSQPVRIGNAAVEQFQLDVWGEVLNCLHLTRDAKLQPETSAWPLQRALADHVMKVWQRPDDGIWEMRSEQRHFVYSKVMAWVALDRVVRAVEDHDLEGPVDEWRRARDAIHSQVCARGFDAERNAFMQSYGSSELDASVLLLPTLGFLPWDDPRIVGTVEAIARDLTRDGLVLRYRPGPSAVDDGVPGEEGAFLACSFWLVEAFAGIGREDEAVALFERLIGLVNDVGLLAEEYEPRAGMQLGNFPQAFSHLALVNAALALDKHEVVTH